MKGGNYSTLKKYNIKLLIIYIKQDNFENENKKEQLLHLTSNQYTVSNFYFSKRKNLYYRNKKQKKKDKEENFMIIF